MSFDNKFSLSVVEDYLAEITNVSKGGGFLENLEQRVEEALDFETLINEKLDEYIEPLMQKYNEALGYYNAGKTLLESGILTDPVGAIEGLIHNPDLALDALEQLGFGDEIARIRREIQSLKNIGAMLDELARQGTEPVDPTQTPQAALGRIKARVLSLKLEEPFLIVQERLRKEAGYISGTLKGTG